VPALDEYETGRRLKRLLVSEFCRSRARSGSPRGAATGARRPRTRRRRGSRPGNRGADAAGGTN